jgi:hypothetical protein
LGTRPAKLQQRKLITTELEGLFTERITDIAPVFSHMSLLYESRIAEVKSQSFW